MRRSTPISEYDVKKLRRRQPSIQTAGAKISWSLSEMEYMDTERFVNNNHSSHDVFIVSLIFSISI